MKKDIIKLRIQPLYSIIIYYALGLIFLFFTFLPTILSWNSDGWIIKLVFYLVCILFFAYGLLQGTLHIQFAEIDKEKITIKNLFQVISVVKWSEISSVRKEKILTYDSKGYISLEWIAIRTNENQDCYKARYNKKGKYPILIIANKKNLSIFDELNVFYKANNKKI